MIRAGLSSFSLHLPDALGDPWYELDAGGKSVSGSFRQTPTLDLLDSQPRSRHMGSTVSISAFNMSRTSSPAIWLNCVPLLNHPMWSCISC